MIMLKLKLPMLPAFADAASESVAEIDWFAGKTYPALFQLKVKYVLAFAGAHVLFDRLRVKGREPVFLT